MEFEPLSSLLETNAKPSQVYAGWGMCFLFRKWCPNPIMIVTARLKKIFWGRKKPQTFNHFMLKDFEILLIDLKRRVKRRYAKKVRRGWWLQHTLKVQAAAAAARILVSPFFKMPLSRFVLQQQVGNFSWKSTVSISGTLVSLGPKGGQLNFLYNQKPDQSFISKLTVLTP